MANISRLPVASVFPSLDTGPVSFVSRVKVTYIRNKGYVCDMHKATKSQETPKQVHNLISRTRKIVKNSLSLCKIK